MKRFLAVCALAASVLAGGRAEADVFKTLNQNEFTTAESLDAGLTQTGVHFTLGEGYKSYYPVIRYGLGAMLEVGVKFGATTADIGPEDKVAGLVGADIKYQLVKQTDGIPLDMAVVVGYDTHLISGKNVSDLTFSTILSRPYALTDRGYKFTPYGGLEMSSLYGSYLRENETDFYLFAGFEWKLAQKSMLFMELKVGDNVLGGAGIRFEY